MTKLVEILNPVDKVKVATLMMALPDLTVTVKGETMLAECLPGMAKANPKDADFDFACTAINLMKSHCIRESVMRGTKVVDEVLRHEKMFPYLFQREVTADVAVQLATQLDEIDLTHVTIDSLIR
jgi:hypothetical protein